MKSLLIINENILETRLGQNTSLYYLVNALRDKRDVYIFNVDQHHLPNDSNSPISCLFLDANSDSATLLIEKYAFFNEKIINLTKNEAFDELLGLNIPTIREFIDHFEQKDATLASFDEIIQRLEPMKAPFPPHGNANIDDVLLQLKTLLGNRKVHLPIKLHDKILPLTLNDILGYEVATPTFMTSLDDATPHEKIDLATQKYQHIYASTQKKIVIKPLNSAQSLGVFAIEFCEDGHDLNTILTQTSHQLNKAQIFHIKDNLAYEELKQILHLLCYVQTTNHDQRLSDITPDEITTQAGTLYQDQILIQPFIEGVRQGDIRANIMKNNHGEFYLAGYVYRKSIQKDDNFTTCYSGGKAISLPITYLTKDEQEELKECTVQILNILNNELKDEYHNVLELGFDFLLVGDNTHILLGEINHHCPALLPISRRMNY